MILTAWLLHSIRLAAALGTALLLMQAPAVTREYQAALLQLVRSSDQEIAERKASAQRFYGIGSGEDDKRFLSARDVRSPTRFSTASHFSSTCPSPPPSMAWPGCSWAR